MIRAVALAAMLAIGMQATGAAQEAAPPDASEIVVTGKRMDDIPINYDARGRPWRCYPQAKPEDVRLGRVMCEVLRACFKSGVRGRTAARDCLYARMDELGPVVFAEVALGLRPPVPEAAGTQPVAGEWEFQGVRTAWVAGTAMSETAYSERKCIVADTLEPMVQNLLGVPILRDASPTCVPLVRSIGGGAIVAAVRCADKGAETLQQVTGRYEGAFIRWQDRRTPARAAQGLGVETRYVVEGRRVGACGSAE